MSSVVLLSGGLDSTIALCWALENGPVDVALSFDYSQRHWVELRQAERIARKMKVRHEVENLGSKGLGFAGLARKAAGGDLSVARNAVVPCRNLMMLGVAGAWVEQLGADELVVGFSADDAHDFPDCRPGFVRAVADALSVSLDRRILVRAPLIGTKKADALKLAKSLTGCWPLIKHTWTCYSPEQAAVNTGHVKPCGKCASCTTRAEAFAQLGEEDPAAERTIRA